MWKFLWTRKISGLRMGSFANVTSANEAATLQENSKNEPDLSHLENLNSTITVMHLMGTFINTVLIPLAASNTTVRRDMEKNTNLALSQMEGKVNSLMQRTIDVTISWVSKLLAGQKKTDFRPKEESMGTGTVYLDLLQTPVSSQTTKVFQVYH